jgi:hypothetical protein
MEVIERNCISNLIEHKPPEKYTQNSLIYNLDDSNSTTVEAALKKRWWWKKLNEVSSRNPALIWTQTKKDDFFPLNKKIIYPGLILIDRI